MTDTRLPHDHGQSIEKELDQMPGAEVFQTAADIFKQLGDGNRVRIFWILCHCEECVINIASMVGMSSPAVSHITSRRSGKEMYYKAAETEQAQLLHHVIEQIVQVTCLSKADGE